MPSDDPQLDSVTSDPHRHVEPHPAARLPDPSHAHDVDPLDTRTDLPLPQCGNGGSPARSSERVVTAADLLAALEPAMAVPVAPPLHEIEPRAVVAWAEASADGLVFRRDRRRLVREVLRLLEDEWSTAQQVERLRQQITSRDEEQRARTVGTYWMRRDSGRRAQQPTHVDVEPEAWVQAKAAARRHEVGVGEYVGRLVVNAILRPASAPTPLSSELTPCNRRTRLFARLAVEKPTWKEFVALSAETHVTVARHVGLVVERSAGPK
jgi:hypothetical protein